MFFGLLVRRTIGLGDSVSLTSIPENFYKSMGVRLVDMEKHIIFDHNPYIERNIGHSKIKLIYDPWGSHCTPNGYKWPRRSVMLSNAESHAYPMGLKVVLNRPRLYRFEEFPFFDRKDILLHVRGRSNGNLPQHVIEHVMSKYGGENLKRIGKADEWIYPFPSPPFIETKTLWELAEVVSKARMLIGVDSGPSWVAACYPDVVIKKVRMIPDLKKLEDYVPLEWVNQHSHWDDRSAGVFNPSENDVGFTWSYRRI